MKVTLLLVLASGFLLSTPPAWAHHSFAAEFDVDKPITLKGVLTQMDWVNPHGWLYIDVAQPDGTIVNWAIEASGANQLLRRGLRQTDFPLGIEIVVEGYAAKSGEPKASGQDITMADGRNFYLSVENPGGGAR